MIGDGGLLPKQWDKARDLLVVLGRGGESLLEALAAQGQERLLVYLPEEATTGEVPESVTVVTSPIDLFDAILRIPPPLPKQVVVRKQPDPWVSEELHGEVARTVEESLRSKQMMQGTAEVQGTTWLMQGIESLPEVANRPSISALRGAFANRPCVIVSPGPSLSKNVHLLPRLAGHALLMTCTHALRTLQGAGVVPDLVIAADPGDLGRHFAGVDVAAIEAMVVGATCRREGFRLPVRRVFAFASNDTIDDWIFEGLEEDARLRTGGSVACSELSLALAMGCDPVIFVGQDLSFPEGRYYSDSNVDGAARIKVGQDGHTFVLVQPDAGDQPGKADAPGIRDADGDLQLTRVQRLQKVPGYHGGLVETSQSFHAFLVWFETVARSLAGKTMLFNCTEGGAHIRGMEHRLLEDVMSAYLKEQVEVGPVLDRAVATTDVAARRTAMAERVRAMLAALEPCLGFARRCRQLAGRAAQDPSRLDSLQRTEKELSAALRPVRFLSLLAQGDIQRAQQRAQEAKTLQENLAAAQTLFEVVERAGRELEAPLRKALEELE